MPSEDSHARPLAGVTVVELGTNVAAPYAAQQLAEYGASVIKVEAPSGDPTRRMGPTPEPGMGPLFLGMNRGKKSVALDLKSELGLAAFKKLLGASDVFIHNVRPHKLAKLGLSHESVCAAHPRLVYAGVHGFHAGGPYGTRPAYDDIIQGMSGLASLSMKQGAAPRYLPSAVADKNASHVAVQAIVAALYARERTGRGCFVEIPMFETMVSNVLAEHMHARHFSPALGPAGYARLLSAERRPFRTRDGYICLMPNTDAQWTKLFEATGRPELASDERFNGVGARTRNIEALYQWVGESILMRTTRDWLDLLESLDIPVAAMNELEDLVDDVHLKMTGHFKTLDDPVLGTVVFPASGVRFDGKPNEVRMAPRLGEHTREALLAAGMGVGDIDALLAQAPGARA